MSEADNKNTPGQAGLYATYATGFFSLSLVPMTSLIVPLWALQLGAAPGMIGIIVASRAVLPFFLSIHGGALMDRLGTRRMLLLFTAIGTVIGMLYPVSKSVWALVLVQLIVGWAQGMGWIGAQIKIAKIAGGNAKYAGRFTFFTTCGTFLGPLIAGVTWDFAGVWGAFILITLWGVGLLIASYALPAGSDRQHPPLRLQEFCPNLSDYVRAFALLAVPAVAFIVGTTFLRIGVISIQSSFYNVYLQGIGLTGTLIGILVSIDSLVGGPATLLAGVASRAIRPHWLLLLCIGIAVVAMCMTPLFGSFPPLLLAASIYGLGVGMGFPLLLSILADAADSKEQGLSVGLRTTANRAASIVIPIVMGFVIELTGIRLGFFVIGGILLVALALVAWATHRSGAFART
jgi:MFS family permease